MRVEAAGGLGRDGDSQCGSVRVAHWVRLRSWLFDQCAVMVAQRDVTSRRGLAPGLVPDSRDHLRRHACRGHCRGARRSGPAPPQQVRTSVDPHAGHADDVASGVAGPDLAARDAAELARLDAVLPAADEDRLAADQRLGDLGAATLEDAADSLSRDAHRRGRLFVAEALEVDEANRLELVDGQVQLLEFASRNACGLEQGHARHAAHGTFNGRAWHQSPWWLLAYAHGRGGGGRLQTAALSPPGDRAPPLGAEVMAGRGDEALVASITSTPGGSASGAGGSRRRYAFPSRRAGSRRLRREPDRGPAKHRPRQPLGVAQVLRHVGADRDQGSSRGAPAQAALTAARLLSTSAARSVAAATCPAAVASRSSASVAGAVSACRLRS